LSKRALWGNYDALTLYVTVISWALFAGMLAWIAYRIG
jgi:hypothetical protein